MPHTWLASLHALLVSGSRWKMQLLTMVVFGLFQALIKVIPLSVLQAAAAAAAAAANVNNSNNNNNYFSNYFSLSL